VDLNSHQEVGSRNLGGFTIVELVSVIAIIGTLAAIALPKLDQAIERARVARAIGDIEAIQTDLDSQDSLPDLLSALGPERIDPWGHPYQYNKFPIGRPVPPGARRDRFLVPINTSYDLYSLGKDGATVPPLTASASQDDVIRGNDGGFIGLASNY
jgi:general secretion pathway protein G